MLRNYYALFLCLFVPAQPMDRDVYRFPIEEQVEQPYVALLNPASLAEYAQADLKSLRSKIEKERDQQIEECSREEERLRKELDRTREQLKELNKLASRDDGSRAERRSALHVHIAALEQVLRDKKNEREHVIPTAFEVKLAKLRLIERWPERRREVVQRIEEGRARDRKHGDVEDIGYRKLVNNPQQDVAVGEQVTRQMTSSGLMPGQVQDSGVQDYVRRLADKIAGSSDLKVPLHVTVLESPEINAIAVPGGFLFVTSGLILAAETEAELAGVLSHQIASIAARHGTRSLTRSVISNIFGPAAQVATGMFTGGITNAGAYYGMNYGLQGLSALVDRSLTGSSTKRKREADQLGIQYMWKAGFDPKGLIAFLDSIARNKQHSVTAGFLRTDPDLGARLVDVFSEIQYLPPREHYAVDSPDFQKAKDRLE